MRRVTQHFPDGKEIEYVRMKSGTCYHAKTHRSVINALESAMLSSPRPRVRIFYGDITTGRDWLAEFDVCGYIGRSTGSIKIPLLIPTSRSRGGPAILDDCIVRIMIAGSEVYRHQSYHLPSIGIVTEGKTVDSKYVLHHVATVEGSVHATFKSYRSAVRWLSFMKGDRQSK